MWYWDYTPSWAHHSKKPLTKAQMKKLELAYKNADAISESVRSIEKEEQEKWKNDIERELNLLL
jgi:hypothetical protein